MEDERDAEYAIRRLDRTEFGRKGRRLRVEWTKVIYDACVAWV
jgi:arginine/serine-rich splicing factor 4/5/6